MRKNNSLSRVQSDFPSLFDGTFNWYANFFGTNTLSKCYSNADGTYSITIDVPGLKEEDISVELKNNYVVVRGETKTEHSLRSVNHTFTIPDYLDTKNVSAVLLNGVLTLSFASLKNEESSVKKIEINSSK